MEKQEKKIKRTTLKKRGPFFSFYLKRTYSRGKL